MKNLKAVLKILILTLAVFKTSAQRGESINLKNYVIENGLYDFGYGLEKYESRLDSVVCFNDFMSSDFSFRELNNNLSFTISDSIFKIVIERKKNLIISLSIRKGKKILNRLVLNDSLKDFTVVSKSYSFNFGIRQYSILYIGNAYDQQTFRGQYLGVLIDNNSKNIISFPHYQSTTSLLNITDLNKNKKLDLICYNPSFTGKVEVFELQDKNWELKNEYTCNLKKSDNFVWQIDFQEDSFLRKYYLSEASR